MADQLGLIDRSGVVVETTGDLELGDDDARSAFGRGSQQGRQRFESRVEQRVLDAECTHLVGEVRRVRFDGGELEAQPLLFLVRSGFGGEQLADLFGTDLVVFVEAAQHGLDVRQSDSSGEAFEQSAVVDDDLDSGHAERGEPGERIGHGQGDLDLEVSGQLTIGDDVDIGLDELTVAAGLWAFAAPDGLDAGCLEREAQVVRVVGDITGQRHREVEVEAERIAFGAFGVESGDREDLLVDLSVLGQLADRFDGAVVEGGEPVQGEGVFERVDDGLLDHAFGRESFRESGQTG